MALALVMVTLLGFLAVWLKQPWVFFVGIAGCLCFYFWRQHMAPLGIVSPQEAKTSNRSAWVMLLASLFPAFFS